MRIGLFIPCYIDQMFPQVGLATVEVLERYCPQAAIEFPATQTCCGQPMANTGCTDQVLPLARHFVEIFAPFDHIVCPSGSCAAMVRHHYDEYFDADDNASAAVRGRVHELCEFLVDVIQIQKLDGRFPYRVGLHQACHGLRELRMGSSSEMMTAHFNKPQQLLRMLDDLEIVELQRADECCGFGGTFAVAEEAVSVSMGRDRIRDHQQAGAEVVTAADMSCLMHLQGLIAREQLPLQVMHIAEILAGHLPSDSGSRS